MTKEMIPPDYLYKLEREWWGSKKRITEKEFLDIFPEAKEILTEKLDEWETEAISLRRVIKRKLILIGQIKDEFSKWFWREWVKINEGENLVKINLHIARLKRQIAITNGQKIIGMISHEQIQATLNVPIENLFNQKFRNNGKTLIGLCPFHSEKTPSFYIYLETNTCWCFGCQQGGNTINSVRLLYGYSFKEAIKYLIEK